MGTRAINTFQGLILADLISESNEKAALESPLRVQKHGLTRLSVGLVIRN